MTCRANKIIERQSVTLDGRTLTVTVEFAQGIDDGKESIAGEGGQCEHGHSGGHVLGEFGQGADVFAPRPRFEGVDDGDEWQSGEDDQEIGQSQREDISGKENNYQYKCIKIYTRLR